MMLSELTPEQFDELQAYHMLEPWGDDWRRSGTIAAMAYNAGLVACGYAAPQGAMSPDDCIPYRTVEKPKPDAPLPDPVALAATMAARWGRK